MNKNFWKNKRVLVTGANGFVGSNLVLELVSKKAEVFALIKDDSIQNPIFNSIKGKLSKIIIGDIANNNLAQHAFLKNKIEFCFHLAGQIIVGNALKSPLTTFRTNILGTINVLESARMSHYIKGLILASTVRVYGNNKKLPFIEKLSLQPRNPYESSKICSEVLFKTYHINYNLPLAIGRFANTYGPGDLNFSRLVPSTIKSILNNQNPKINNSKSVRDFIYVKDAVSAYMTLAENIQHKGVRGEVFNFGSNSKVTVNEITKKVIKISQHKNLKINHSSTFAENEVRKQYLSISKAQKLLKWKPNYNIEKGLKETYIWYKNFLNNRLVA